jgi:hypothetical protein
MAPSRAGNGASCIWRLMPPAGMIVAQTLTDQDADDLSQVGPLLDQIGEPIGQVTADCVYDGSPTYQTIAAYSDGNRGGDPTALDGYPQRRTGPANIA